CLEGDMLEGPKRCPPAVTLHERGSHEEITPRGFLRMLYQYSLQDPRCITEVAYLLVSARQTQCGGHVSGTKRDCIAERGDRESILTGYEQEIPLDMVVDDLPRGEVQRLFNQFQSHTMP